MIQVHCSRINRLWETSRNEDDLEVARSIPESSFLYEQALWARARRKDRSVIPHVVVKIKEAADPTYWLHVSRYVWAESLNASLEQLLDRLAEEELPPFSNLEDATADALHNVDPRRAVAMLRKRWARLMAKPLIVQFLLLCNVPDAVALAANSLGASMEPQALLKYFVWKAMMAKGGRRALQSEAQLRNILPYVDFLSGRDLEQLWDVCRKNGWTSVAAQHLEQRLQRFTERRVHIPGDPIDTKELEDVHNGGPPHHHRWLEHTLLRGVSRDEAFAGLLKWLANHDEPHAFEVARAVVGNSATRREFQRFHDIQVRRSYTDAGLSATKFEVFCRSIV